MDPYTTILETSGDLRVRLEMDPCPDEPYDDGASPLLRLDYSGYGWKAEHVMATGRPTDLDVYVEAAAARWGTDFGLLAKYLRAFHGATQVETWHSGSYWYVTYDSAAWREYAGAPEGSASMAEYRAWCEGDVWNWVVEERVTWHSESHDDMDTWETVDSCGGYYGSEYAEHSALLALADARENRARTAKAATGAEIHHVTYGVWLRYPYTTTPDHLVTVMTPDIQRTYLDLREEYGQERVLLPATHDRYQCIPEHGGRN